MDEIDGKNKDEPVEINSGHLESLLKIVDEASHLLEDDLLEDTEQTIDELINNIKSDVDIEVGSVDDDTYITDIKFEQYGYAVINTHKYCFVPLPAEIVNNTSPRSNNHLTNERNEEILHSVAEQHELEDTSHLRVVRVLLDNELDKKAIQFHDSKTDQ